MFQEDIGLVHQIAREIAKEEIAKAIKELTPKPVEAEAKVKSKIDATETVLAPTEASKKAK
jgi:hypothetical protein